MQARRDFYEGFESYPSANWNSSGATPAAALPDELASWDSRDFDPALQQTNSAADWSAGVQRSAVPALAIISWLVVCRFWPKDSSFYDAIFQ
jgi:hypothetical protein